MDRQDPPQLMARTRPWWQFTILAVIAFACVSCSDAVHQMSHPRGGAVQYPHITEAARLPLTDSAPPQLDVTPTVPVTPPTPLRVPAIAIPTSTPVTFQILAIDDSVEGTGLNQFNYVGSSWNHCNDGCNGCNCYDGTWSGDDVTGDYVTVSFTGVQIKFYVVIGPDGGIGAISLDGGSETMIDFYSTKYTGDLLMWTSPMLPAGTHTFKLRVTGTKDPGSKDYNMGVDRVDILS